MGLILFISIVVVIAIIAYLLAYFLYKEGGIPPYQDSVSGEKPQATWPFPHNKP